MRALAKEGGVFVHVGMKGTSSDGHFAIGTWVSSVDEFERWVSEIVVDDGVFRGDVKFDPSIKMVKRRRKKQKITMSLGLMPH